jgi:hypothetical protein
MWNQGAPIGIPSALASLLRAMAHPIVIAQDDDRQAVQARPENALAGNIEVVAVNPEYIAFLTIYARQLWAMLFRIMLSTCFGLTGFIRYGRITGVGQHVLQLSNPAN